MIHEIMVFYVFFNRIYCLLVFGKSSAYIKALLISFEKQPSVIEKVKKNFELLFLSSIVMFVYAPES